MNHNKVRLYKWQFIPNIKHAHTLAFISLLQPIGALLPLGELQSRWFAQLMAGKLKLPSRAVMDADIVEKERFQKRFYESDRHSIQVDWVDFMEELATEIGANPPVWSYLFTDPKLFFTLVFGAAAPYQYRLVGPNPWSGARDAMLTVQDRIDAALQTNHSKVKSGKKSSVSMKNLNFIHYIVIFGALFLSFALLASTWLVRSLSA